MKENFLTVHSEKMELTNLLESGRYKAMSLFNFHLDISYFNININVKENQEKKNVKMRKDIENHTLREQELDRRRNLDFNSMLYSTIIHR